MSWPIIWIIIAIVLAVIEIATMGLSTIWFTAGALVALVAAWLNLHYMIQIVLFFASSAMFLMLTRPLVVKYLKIGSVKTNVDSLIGKSGIVVATISEHQYGQVRLNGQVWTAKAEGDLQIDNGTEVEVTAIEGVKLVVKCAD